MSRNVKTVGGKQDRTSVVGEVAHGEAFVGDFGWRRAEYWEICCTIYSGDGRHISSEGRSVYGL